MPTTKSAAKRLRQSVKLRLRNRSRKSLIKTTEKKFLEKVDAKDVAGATAALTQCFSEFDRAAKLGAIHRNKADRKKQRLAAKLAALQTK